VKLFLFATLGLIFSQYAIASNDIQKMLDENPTKSPKAVLQKAFEESVDQIRLEDVQSLENKCVISNTEYDILQDVYLTRITPMTPEIPGKGPLFPGTPAVFKNGVLLLTYFSGTLPSQEMINQYFPYVEVNLSNVQIDTIFNTGFMDGSINHEVLSIRKNRELLVFSRAVEWNYNKPATVEYGYCW
jgi:hypothetical protein